MNRRDFIKLTGAASVDAFAEQPAPAFRGADKPQPRQAIVILGESVRYDMLNCNARTGLHTPNLDRIARRGNQFRARLQLPARLLARALRSLDRALPPHQRRLGKQHGAG